MGMCGGRQLKELKMGNKTNLATCRERFRPVVDPKHDIITDLARKLKERLFST